MPVPVSVQTPPMPPQTPSASSESESESESHAASGAVQWSVQSLSALPLLVTSDSIRTRASMILSRSVSTFASAITHGVDEVLDVAAASLENVSHAAASAVTNVAGHAAEAAAAAIRKAQQAQTFIKDREGLRARAAASDPAANVDVQIGCTCYEDAPPELRSRLWMAVAQIERGGDDLVLAKVVLRILRARHSPPPKVKQRVILRDLVQCVLRLCLVMPADYGCGCDPPA